MSGEELCNAKKRNPPLMHKQVRALQTHFIEHDIEK